MLRHFRSKFGGDEFELLKRVLERNTEEYFGIRECGKSNNMKLCLCVPINSHNTSRTSAAVSIYCIIGDDANGIPTAYRPDGRKTAYYKNGEWKYLNRYGGWMEAKYMPYMKTSTGEMLPLGEEFFKVGAPTIYKSKFIWKNYDAVVIIKDDFKFHYDTSMNIQKLIDFGGSSLIETVKSWIKKKHRIYMVKGVKLFEVRGSIDPLVRDD